MMAIAFLLLFQILSVFGEEIHLDCGDLPLHNASLSAYYPDYSSVEEDDGYLDMNGNHLMTLQEYLDDRSDYVSVAMDSSLLLPYGTEVCSPELNHHFGRRVKLHIVDTSPELLNQGFFRLDICVRTEADSYDHAVNRDITYALVPQFEL